jgi:hypothetical protein
MCIFKIYYYTEQRHGHVLRERKVNTSSSNEIPEGNSGKNRRERVLETHTLGERTRWRKYRTK